jgi:anaerobic magnesium-protoporphyrin IX monomethyl ester cyclase
MKIALVSTYTHPIALGLRYLSSYLKSAGHDVEMIFMSSRRDTVKPDFSSATLEHLVEHVRTRELIGLSLMTNSFHRACALTQHLRHAGVKTPIVWGGTHPTVAPDESLEHADAICRGEGEEPVRQLVERLETGRDPTTVAGFDFCAGGWFGNRETIRNRRAPLQVDLDRLPFPDYELETHWVAQKDGLVPARPDNLRGTLHVLRVLTSRGCPYHCAFCNNAALQKLFKGCGPWLRLRSPDNVLSEIRQALACFPTIERVNFVDDLFFVRSEEQIEAFAARYTREVGLPLQMDAFPNTVSEGKVRALARVPIELISMGIESASEDTLRNLYRRPTPPKRIAEAIDTFKRHRIRTEYHYIVSNPYEPDENVIETMRFVANHHRGQAVLRVFALMFYPGTPLYERARSDGLIGPRDQTAYDYMGTGALEFIGHNYLAIWLRVVLNLRNVGLPPWIAHRVIDFATNRVVRKVIDRKWFPPAVFHGYQLMRKLGRNFIYQPFVRPLKYLRRQPRSGKQDDADQAAQPLARWTVPRIAPEPRYDEPRAAVSAPDERAPQPSDTSLSGTAAE